MLDIKEHGEQIIVGSSPVLLDFAYGEFIDSFKTIIRFNKFIIDEYEKYVGTRVTGWSTTRLFKGMMKKYKFRNIFFVGKPKFLSPVQKAAHKEQISLTIVPRTLRIICARKLFPKARLRIKALPSGMCFILFAVNVLLWKPTVIGFDAYQKCPNGQYYKPETVKVKEGFKVHGKQSLKILEKLEEQGKIKWVR